MRAPVWIAERQVIFVHPDGRRELGQIAIGQPYTLGGDYPSGNYESLCPLDIGELYGPRQVVAGGTLGALLAAVEFAAVILQQFYLRGGRVLDPEDESEIKLEYFFGWLRDENKSQDGEDEDP